jgi:hypothetical protein
MSCRHNFGRRRLEIAVFAGSSHRPGNPIPTDLLGHQGFNGDSHLFVGAGEASYVICDLLAPIFTAILGGVRMLDLEQLLFLAHRN